MASTELELTATKDVQLERAGVDPMLAMMERLASNKDVDVVKLQALIDMQKDILSVNAKAAFNTAFAQLQKDIPTVIEKGRGDKGMSYARLEDIIEAVRPVLHRHGFSLSHQTEWLNDGKAIKVIGILTHQDGYERRSEFVAAADQTGSKNAIQALGSSNSYGRRYTTKDLLNIVTKEEDDDGRKAQTKVVEPDGFERWYDDMDAMVQGGCTWEQFKAAWNPENISPFREHLAKVNPSKIEQWKKKAKAAKDA